MRSRAHGLRASRKAAKAAAPVDIVPRHTSVGVGAGRTRVAAASLATASSPTGAAERRDLEAALRASVDDAAVSAALREAAVTPVCS